MFGAQTAIWPVLDTLTLRVLLLPVDMSCMYADEYTADAPGAQAVDERLVDIHASGLGRRKKTVRDDTGVQELPPMVTAQTLPIIYPLPSVKIGSASVALSYAPLPTEAGTISAKSQYVFADDPDAGNCTPYPGAKVPENSRTEVPYTCACRMESATL